LSKTASGVAATPMVRKMIAHDRPSLRMKAMSLRASTAELLKKLPGPPSPKSPDGVRFVEAFAHGSLVVELYAPVVIDPQLPHARDEVYFVVSGSGDFVVAGERSRFIAGDALFVAAGIEHRFENFTPDFSTWVVFYGPPGGE
jgi:mannose-6-phosphate isomerase-like protein (cupin superfamily)